MQLKHLISVLCALLLIGCESGSSESASSRHEGQSQATPDRVTQQAGDPFPIASEVRLFVEVDYVGETLTPVLSNVDGILLTTEQRTKVAQSLVIEAAPEFMAACFVPHHFFRYYNADGELVGTLQVCFCCEGVQTSGKSSLRVGADQILTADYEALKSLVRALGEPTEVLCDQ